MNPKTIFEYYLSEKFKIELPSETKFRHFRFRNSKGLWKKIPEKIQNEDDFKKWIIKIGALDCYYSTSQWLNPHKISSKGGSGTYHVADNLLLNNDLVFDIDAEEPITLESLNEARKSTNNIFEGMKKFTGYQFEYCSFSGYKGFRLSYKDTNLELPIDPRLRLEFIENRRKLFIDGLLFHIKNSQNSKEYYKINTFFDQKITTNVMCVIRVLGTIHSKTGYVSQKIPPSQLRKGITEILNHIPYVGKSRPVIPRKREMKECRDKKLSWTRLLTLGKVVSGLTTFPNFKYYITNRVLGIKKGFIPIFIYQKGQKYRGEIIRLQQEYKLGYLYIFNVDNQVVVISLKTMQRRQLKKVLNKSSSRTKYDIIKHNRIFAPFSLKPDELIKGPFTGTLSLGHKHFLDPFKKVDIKNYCGWDQVELIQAEIGDNRG